MIRRLVMTLVLLCAACDDYTHAVEPVWNKQPCTHCHMLISDPRYAAQLVTRSHERLYFDDPGCLASYMQDHTADVEHAWVHVDDTWTGIESARFSVADSSPMGYGLRPDSTGDKKFSDVTQVAIHRREQGSL